MPWPLVIILFVLLTLVYPAFAQDVQYASRETTSPLDRPLGELHHTSYGERDNAPTSADAIVQDSKGFLWLGTPAGMIRFDGVTFERRFADLKLPSRAVLTVFVDEDDSFWVGYATGGLAHIKDGALTLYEAPQIPGGSLYSVLYGPRHQLWIAAVNGIARLDHGTWIPVGHDLGYDGHQPEAMQMQGGTLRIIDVQGVWKLPPGASRFEKFDRQAAIDDEWRSIGAPSRLYDVRVDGAAFVDSSGALWVAVKEGLERNRWVRASNGEWQRQTETFKRSDGLSGNDVRYFFEDKEHNVWVLTDLGVDRFRASKFHPLALPGNIAAPAMVIGTDDSLWISTTWESSVGVAHGQIVSLPTLPRGVRAMLHDAKGRVWLADGLGEISRFENGRKVVVALPPDLKEVGERFQALAIGPEGDLWVAASAFGLYRYDGEHWRRIDDVPYAKVSVERMSTDAQGNLWLACTDSTLIRVGRDGTTVYGQQQGLNGGTLKALAFGHDALWVGGDDGLFFRRLNGSGFSSASIRGKVPLRSITGIVETPEGELWLSTMDGVFQFSAEEVKKLLREPGHRMNYTIFGPQDGLISIRNRVRPIPNLVQTADGKIWYAAESSVSWIDPKNILRNAIPPRTAVDHVAFAGAVFSGDAPVVLPPNPGRIDIAYTAASYAEPEKVAFLYRLLGFERDWHSSKQRLATYTNLSPGHYLFELTAINEDGVSSVAPLSVKIDIQAAWYQTTLFRIALVVATTILLALLYFMRMRALQARTLARVEARHQERERIARDVHDTLLQDLQGLLLRIQSWAGDLTLPDWHRQDITSAADCARESIADGRDRIYELRRVTIDNLPDQLELCCRLCTEKYDFSFSSECYGKPVRLSQDVSQEIILIVQEATRNACTHSQGGNVLLTIRYSWLGLRITVRDDGSGMSDELLQVGRRSGHWGLDGMRERASAIGGKLRISRSNQGGTLVALSLRCLGYHRARVD